MRAFSSKPWCACMIACALALSTGPSLASAHAPETAPESENAPDDDEEPSDPDKATPDSDEDEEPSDPREESPGSDRTTDDEAAPAGEPEEAPDPADGSAPVVIDEPTPATPMVPVPTEPDDRRHRERSSEDRLLLAGGIVAVSLGVVAAVPMVVGLALGGDIEQRLADYPADPKSDPDLRDRQERKRIDLIREGQTMNRLAIGSGIVAGVYVTSGLILLGLALTGRRATERRAAVGPALGRDHAGLLIRGRF